MRVRSSSRRWKKVEILSEKAWLAVIIHLCSVTRDLQLCVAVGEEFLCSPLQNIWDISKFFFVFLFINVSVFVMSGAKHYEKHINQEKCKTFCLQSLFSIF